MDFKISYGVTVSDEHEELDKLLSFLYDHKREVDEIVVQGDAETVTQEVESTTQKHGATYIRHPLNRNFSQFKNNLTKKLRSWLHIPNWCGRNSSGRNGQEPPPYIGSQFRCGFIFSTQGQYSRWINRGSFKKMELDSQSVWVDKLARLSIQNLQEQVLY